MRSFRATHNLIAVSAGAAETAINTEQTLDTTMLCALSDVINLDPRRETNADEAHGLEEPDTIYHLGATAGTTFNFNKAQPQHFAFVLAYGLGAISTAAAGTGYEHTLTPIAGDCDGSRSIPSFTAAERFGDVILKRRFASMFVDAFEATFAADDWVKLAATIKGTGKYTDSVIEETVSALPTATELTLAANGVQGATAATRLDNVQRIRAELSEGVWTDVDCSAVSDASPAVITITAPGEGAVAVNYKVLYVPAEAAWCTFPARIAETPLRVAQMTLTLGGAWNGSEFTGGRALAAELKSIGWSFNNNGTISFVPGAGDDYAGRYFRSGRTQTASLNREMRDCILQQHIEANDTFGLRILVEGAVYDDPHKYQVDIVFPKLGVLKAPVSVDGKVVAEAGDLQVLEDATYGSVIAKVKNLQSAYAA